MVLVIQLLFLFVFNSQAFEPLSLDQIIKFTSLSEKAINDGTQANLETELFNDGDGISCGLQEFRVIGFEAEKSAMNGTFDKFTVITEVEGPVGSCEGYENYQCYTYWKLNSDQVWEAKTTDCDEGNVY